MKTYAKANITRKYYKYIYTPWTQPVLTGDSTSSELKVSASYVEGSHYAFHMLDSSSSTYYSAYANDSGNTYYMTFNSQICITKLVFTFEHSKAYSEFSTTTVQGSNDNVNWTNISQSWNTNGTMTLNNTQYFKYYKLYQQWWWTAYNCVITATKQTIGAGTKDDYDFYIDSPTIYFPKVNNKYYVSKRPPSQQTRPRYY